MDHSTEDREELMEFQLLLDSEAGPARPISHQQAVEMVRAALELANNPQPHDKGPPRRARSRRTIR
ncbi:hypothetical protein [Hyalangium versicolor]|uniref:hypothetical protein n=1 Tax=Hyalangium versicolor TaxID=2861190 RepID=UPI001CCACC7B|nr:hypothetical protein [Hyalangium versicolor]